MFWLHEYYNNFNLLENILQILLRVNVFCTTGRCTRFYLFGPEKLLLIRLVTTKQKSGLTTKSTKLQHQMNYDICDFWEFTQPRIVVPYRSFGTNYHSDNNCSLTARSLKMGPTICPETSVRKDNPTSHKIPKRRRYHIHRSGSLTSRKEYARR
jgi:hypothetical protein